MRFTLTGVCFIMAMVLAIAVTVTKIIRHESSRLGHPVALVILHSMDPEGLQRALDDDNTSIIRHLKKEGISFMRMGCPSPWYPSAMASLLTGLTPTEHGVHRGHAHLTEGASTVAEVLGACGYQTFAAIGESSLLDSLNILKDFSDLEKVPPGDTITAFLQFLERRREERSFFALIEIDVDAWGGPSSLPTVIETLYEGMGGTSYLENGVLALMASKGEYAVSNGNPSRFDPWMSAVISGTPKRIGSGKYLLKPTSLCDMEKVLLDLALGKGFLIRDAVRIGRPVVAEWFVEQDGVPIGEVSTHPPYFCRLLWFDDNPYRLLVPPSGQVRILESGGGEGMLDPEQEELLRLRYEAFLADRTPQEDLIIPAFAGPPLDRGLAERLGAAWNRDVFMGHPLHAVEHMRMAEEMRERGYSALALNECIAALMLDQDFSEALFQLAEIYATIDPEGARKHYRTFLKRFGEKPECEAQAEKAKRFLGLSSR